MAAAPPVENDLKRTHRIAALLTLLPLTSFAALEVVIVEGLGGDVRYEEQFSNQVDALRRAALSLTEAGRIRVFRSDEASREAVLAHFDALGEKLNSDDRLAVFLVGHGSFDDHQYKFNVKGPDLTDEDLVQVLDALDGPSQLVVNTSSASGAIAELLRKDGRTLILATRSGAERHATRFGNYFTAALTDASADTDKNGIVTAEEAFRFASRQVEDYFERNGQLATEHARLEGAQAGRFSLARLGAVRPVRDDAVLRRLLAAREQLNADIDALRLRRDDMAADAYQQALLENMLELATLEDAIEAREAELDDE